MNESGSKLIALAIAFFALVYAITNRYEITPSPIANVIMSKDTWTGATEFCTTERCLTPSIAE